MHPTPRLVEEYTRNPHPAHSLILHEQLGQALQFAKAKHVVFLERHPLAHGEAGFTRAASFGWSFGRLFLVGFGVLVDLFGLLVLLVVVVAALFIASRFVLAALLATIILLLGIGISAVSVFDLLEASLQCVLLPARFVDDLLPGLVVSLHRLEFCIFVGSPFGVCWLL